MTQQLTFTFNEQTETAPLELRRKAMEKVLDNAGEAFRAHFTAFVLLHLSVNATSDGETIRELYETTSLPQPHRWQAAGGVYARLRREGKIVEVGKVRSKKFGNDLAVIALVREVAR